MPTWLSIALGILGGTGLLALVTKEIYNLIKRYGKRTHDLYEEKKLDQLKQVIGEVVEKKLEPVKSDLVQIKEEQSKIKEDLQITKEGIQVELRHDIRNSCRRCIAQGFRTFDDVEEVEAMHEKYEKLAPNGITNNLYDNFELLKIVPNDYKKEKSVSKKTNKKILTEDK